MWEFRHSVTTAARPEVAWDFWTDMDNIARMEEGVERIELDGPFAAGTRGRTVTADYQQEWTLAEVVQGRRVVLAGETADGRVSMRFAWDFEPDGGGTRLTQHIRATGPGVADQLPIFRGMERHAPAAMDRLAAELDRVARTQQTER